MSDPTPAAAAASPERASRTPARPRRRGRRLVLGAAIAVTVVSLILDPLGWRDVPWFESSLASPVGETLRETLPDDSLLVLGDDSAAKVAYYVSRRNVTLSRGWLGVQVDPRSNSPFIVSLGSAGQVRATGTRFGVRLQDDGFSVAVREGSVEIRTGPWWDRHVTRLYAGGIATVASDETVSVRRHDADPLEGR